MGVLLADKKKKKKKRRNCENVTGIVLGRVFFKGYFDWVKNVMCSASDRGDLLPAFDH